ncbi:MAG: hypothetical protein MH252_10635 [Thermosynechococcaceae cyanobacterium MS004]|nr:hypothetical protein [Thermosynechococcaceae cyanobacterium MS004]
MNKKQAAQFSTEAACFVRIEAHDESCRRSHLKKDRCDRDPSPPFSPSPPFTPSP